APCDRGPALRHARAPRVHPTPRAKWLRLRAQASALRLVPIRGTSSASSPPVRELFPGRREPPTVPVRGRGEPCINQARYRDPESNLGPGFPTPTPAPAPQCNAAPAKNLTRNARIPLRVAAAPRN